MSASTRRIALALERLDAVAPDLSAAIRAELAQTRRQCAGYRAQLRQLQHQEVTMHRRLFTAIQSHHESLVRLLDELEGIGDELPPDVRALARAIWSVLSAYGLRDDHGSVMTAEDFDAQRPPTNDVRAGA